MNELTRKLLAEGWTLERHPDYVYRGRYDEGLEYKWEHKLKLVWQTGCGLLVKGWTVATSDAWFMGVQYCPENGNPLLRCPYNNRKCEHIPEGFPLPMCPCRLTDQPYDYEASAEKVSNDRAKARRKQYMEITGGQYCACVVDCNGYEGGRLEVRYDVDKCIRTRCRNQFCSIRKKERDLTPVNIFYDIRRTWITRAGFLEETKTAIEKGQKVFPRPVARTDAEIWLKIKKAEYNPLTDKTIIRPHLTWEDRRQRHFSDYHRTWPGYDYFEFHYQVENIRIERRETRDILQDLRDVEDGIEVVHASDLQKAAKAQKRERLAKARQARERRKSRQDPSASSTQEYEQMSFMEGAFESNYGESQQADDSAFHWRNVQYGRPQDASGF